MPREVQTPTSSTGLLSPVPMAILRTPFHDNPWAGCAKEGALPPGGRGRPFVQPRWTTGSRACPKRTLQPPSDPALPLTAIDPDKGSLLSVKRPTRFRQPSSQEQHMERHSWSMDRCLAEQAAVLLPNRSGLSNPAAQKWVPWAAPVLRRETLTRKERGLGGRHTAHGKPLPSPISPGTPRNCLPGKEPLHCHPDGACQMGG